MVWDAAVKLLELTRTFEKHSTEVIDGHKRIRLTVRRNNGGVSVRIEDEGFIRESYNNGGRSS